MKIYNVTKDGVRPAVAQSITLGNTTLWAITHGERGRSRWEVVIPLSPKDFGLPTEKDRRLELSGDYDIIMDENRRDPHGNPFIKIIKGNPDGRTLVFLRLSPGFRGGASITSLVGGKVIAKGEEAQGDAGMMGGAACPIILFDGPGSVEWNRRGRLYGGPANLRLVVGEKIYVSPIEQDDLANWALEEGHNENC